MEAVKAMKEGKKVRRPDYGEGAYKVKRENFIGYQNESGSLPHLTFEDYEATDWQIVEEKKTLSDKKDLMIPATKIGVGEVQKEYFAYKEEDVKEAIKEYLKGSAHDDNGMSRAKQIFGERLL